MLKKMFLLIGFLLMGYAFSQVKHTVTAKETVYGISKQYGISQEDLLNANPKIKTEGLKIGDVLTIPSGVSQTTLPTTKVVDEDDEYFYLVVGAKETLYNLSHKYKVTEQDILTANPSIKEGIKMGERIKIPKKTDNTILNDEGDGVIYVPRGKHLVKEGETAFSIAKQYELTVNELKKANPGIDINRLQVNSLIFITRSEDIKTVDPVKEKNYTEHVVEPQQTLFGIARSYNIGINDIIDNNDLSRGLQAGSTIKIPNERGIILTKTDESSGKTGVKSLNRIKDDVITVVLLLPYNLDDAKGNETLKTISNDILTGAKLALEEQAKIGKNIKLKVVDSGSSLDKFIDSYTFSEADVIVGPLFAKNLITVAEYLKTGNIPIVSPIANSDELKEYPNVFIATPDNRLLVDTVVSEIKSNYAGEEIFILTDSKHLELSEYAKEELSNATKRRAKVQIIESVDQIIQPSETIVENLDDGTTVKEEYAENIITLLISEDNNLGNSYVEKLKKLNTDYLKSYGVKYVAAYDKYSKENEENREFLNSISFKFATSRLVDVYGNNESAILDKFIERFCETPSEYQQIGYDVIFDIVQRMNKGGDITSFSNEQKVLSTNFKYERFEGKKAYLNNAVKLIKFRP